MVSRVEAMNPTVEPTKITPTEALEVAFCVTLLDLAVFGAARFTALRLKRMGEWRNMELGYSKLEFLLH